MIEGKGAYTAVDGERTMMEPGDFVITPSWTWHDHGNAAKSRWSGSTGSTCLLVDLMESGFRDGYPDKTHPVTRPEGAADAEFAYNLLAGQLPKPRARRRRSSTTPMRARAKR